MCSAASQKSKSLRNSAPQRNLKLQKVKHTPLPTCSILEKPRAPENAAKTLIAPASHRIALISDRRSQAHGILEPICEPLLDRVGLFGAFLRQFVIVVVF